MTKLSRHKLDDLRPHLVTAAEIARRAGVRPSAVVNWQTRGLGFPEPVIRLYYDWRQVEPWLAKRPQRKRVASTLPPAIAAIANPIDDYRYPRRRWRP